MGGFSILSEEGLETFGRYYSFYICKVLDNKDPLNMGRLQLINYQINEGYVFWAFAKSHYGSKGFGSRKPIPKKGDLVIALFQQGNVGAPVWDYLGWVDPKHIPEDFKDINVFGIITKSGHKFLINDDTGEVTVYTKGRISIDCEDTIVFNQGNNQGLVKIQELTDKLNNLVNEIETLRNAFNTHTHSGVTSGTSVSGVTNNMVSKPITKFNKSDYENPKIKQ